MSPTHTALVLALVPGLTGLAEAGKGAKKGKHPVHGQVTAVQVDAAKGTGTITVQVQHHKKKADTTEAPAEKKFTVSADTKVEIVRGKKGAVGQENADLKAIHKGDRVFVFHEGDNATDVKIVKKGKGNKQTT
jgi:hypothetical protein